MLGRELEKNRRGYFKKGAKPAREKRKVVAAGKGEGRATHKRKKAGLSGKKKGIELAPGMKKGGALEGENETIPLLGVLGEMSARASTKEGEAQD